MPTLTTIDPDTIDLDYFYNTYHNSFSIRIYEDSSNIPRPILSNKKPTECLSTELRKVTKTCHYFEAPVTTSIIKCLCNKYHTHFISKENKTYKKPTNIQIVSKREKEELALKIANATAMVPPSPTSSPSSSFIC